MNKTFKQKLPYTIFFLLLLILGCLYLFQDSMHQYPAFVHSWTQSDRLALAMNFQDNGFDFFHPATFNLLTKDGVTQVDFPIHDYLVALIGEIFNWDLVKVFRWYNLIFSLIGAVFFYKVALLIHRSPLKAIFTTIFIFSLPFMVFYQNGFLPSIPSFSCFAIALYYLVLYRSKPHSSTIYLLSILFFTLAALPRIPFTIFLVALIGERIFHFIRTKKIDWLGLLSPLIGIGLVFSYYLYNQSLAETYGSQFLNEFLYPDSIGEFYQNITDSWERWNWQLISPFHALSLIIFLVIGLKQIKQEGFSNRKQIFLLIYSLIALPGVFLYYVLMQKQFIDHDYYYIDSFLPLFSLFLLLLVAEVKIPSSWFSTSAVLALIFLIGFYSMARDSQEDRYTPAFNDRSNYTFEVFKASEADLRAWGVEKEDTLLLLDVQSTNIAFTLWENHGYTTMNSGKDSTITALNRVFDYAIILDSFKISDSYLDFPAIAEHLKLLASNGDLSLYEKKSTNSGKGSFFENLVLNCESDFEEQFFCDSIRLQEDKLIQIEDSLKKSYQLGKNAEFDLSQSKLLDESTLRKDLIVGLKASYLAKDSAKEMQLVISIPPFYTSFYLENELQQNSKWEQKVFKTKIPAQYLAEGKELKIYFWNPKSKSIFIDNYQLIVCQ